MQTIFQNVRLFNPDRQEGMTATCDLMVSEGRIARIGNDLPIPHDVEIIKGAGNLLMPGLINGHFHSSVNHMRGRLPSMPLEIFMLYECPEL